MNLCSNCYLKMKPKGMFCPRLSQCLKENRNEGNKLSRELNYSPFYIYTLEHEENKEVCRKFFKDLIK